MTTFTDAFSQRLKDIERRAKAAGSNMTQICKSTGVARATYERWRSRAPQTVAKVDELEAEVIRLEQVAAQSQSTEQGAA